MAELIDSVEETGGFAAVEELQKQTENPKEEIIEEEVAIPEKFKGKSQNEILKAYMETEKALSRQGQELGQVRKLADDLLKRELVEKAEREKPAKVDFFENPDEAVRQAVESNPKVIAAEQYADQYRKAAAVQKLAQKHPDFQQIVQEDGFREYIASSKIRSKLYEEAENFDFDAGDELLSNYKQIKAAKQAALPVVNEAEKAVRKKAIDSASIDGGGTSETSKKIYRSADLIRLRMRDPARYEAMSDEIYIAYQEGRVR